MVNIPVTGAVKVEYAITGGGTYAVFVGTTTPTKWEIGLKTVDGVTDVLERVCVTYTEGAAFANVPANATTATQHQATHYLRKLENDGTENWWPTDAAFGFAGDTKTVCVVTDGQVQGAEVAGPFPKPQTTTTTTSVTPTTTTTVLTCGGKSVGGYCWYLGALGASCTATCAAHGGVTDGTISFAGSGGSIAQCNQVLSAIAPADPAPPTTDDGPLSVGCRTLSGGAGEWYWHSSPTTQDAVEGIARRACSCAN